MSRVGIWTVIRITTAVVKKKYVNDKGNNEPKNDADNLALGLNPIVSKFRFFVDIEIFEFKGLTG